MKKKRIWNVSRIQVDVPGVYFSCGSTHRHFKVSMINNNFGNKNVVSSDPRYNDDFVAHWQENGLTRFKHFHVNQFGYV